MKRLFLLIPVLVFSLLANATVINITPTSPKSSDNLRRALASAADGDIIEMAAGTYEESNSDYIAFTGKNVTVRAAEGAEVILVPKVQIRLKEGSRAEFIGIKFDCGHLSDISSYSNLIATNDNTDGKKLILTDCEFYGWAQNTAILRTPSGSKIDSIVINNCYFHNCYKSVLYCEDTNLIGVEINNSTFANISGTYWAAPIYIPATSGKLVVDHCTFYNVEQADAGSGVVTTTLADATVSNCIFMFPTSGNICATKLPAGGQVKNTLTYNYDNWQPYGHYNTATVTDCVKANPLFMDAANNDFTLRMGSPARGAATDASAIGDSRWTEIISIVTDFSSPLVLEAVDATKNAYYSLDANNYLKSVNPDPVTTEYGIAEWRIHSNTPASVQTTLNMYSGSLYGHTYKVAIYNSNSEKIGEIGESGWSDAKTDIMLTGAIYLPEAGDYTIRLSNICNGSVATIQGITLSYAGGATQDIPGTLTAADAVFSDKGTRADGMISFSTYADQWVKWNASTSGSGAQAYAVMLNINNPTAYGHRFTVSFYLNEDESPVASLTESSWNETFGTPLAIDLGETTLTGGNTYVVKVTNAENGAQPKIISVELVAAGGAVQDIPGTITLSEAILSARAYMDGDDLHFTDGDHLGTISGEYAKWNIHAASEGVYTFTAHCTSTNYSNLTIKVLDTDENELYSYTPQYTYTGEDKVITSPEWILAAGDYVLRLSNPANNSNGYLLSLAAAKSDIIVLDENATSASVIHDNNGVNTKKIALMRSFKADMYNTICLPFSDWNSSLELVFGTGYQLLKLNTATIDGDVLDLEFETVTELGHGRPYLIKPTKDVTNPIFGTGHTIDERTSGYSTTVCDNADFIGNFIKGTIPAGEDNLFLGQNNLLYFSESTTTIKGMRAYFEVKNSSGAPIRHARIVEQSEVVTELELINGEWQDIKSANGTIKTIENGQLILIRDGKRYNVMGIRF